MAFSNGNTSDSSESSDNVPLFRTYSTSSTGSDTLTLSDHVLKSWDLSLIRNPRQLTKSPTYSSIVKRLTINDYKCGRIGCETCGDDEQEEEDNVVPQEPMMVWSKPDAAYIQSGLYVCYIHSQVGNQFCLTCSTPLCPVCKTLFHEGHVFEDLTAVIKNDIAASSKLECEISRREKDVQEVIDLIQANHQTLEDKKNLAMENATMIFARMRAALDEKEKATLKGIEDTKNEKVLAMARQQDALEGFLTELNDVAIDLKIARKRTIQTNNPMHLKRSLAETAGMCFQVRRGQNTISKNEKHWISFTAQEEKLLTVLRTFGSLITKNPGTVGEGRYTKQSDNSSIIESSVPSILPKIALNPRGGPITTSHDPVIVKSQWNYPDLLTPPISVIGKNLIDPSDPDNLSRPWGVACDIDSNVYVADRSNNRIMVFKENGAYIRQFGSVGSGAGQFNRPAGIAIDCYKRIIVADKDNHRIQVLEITGRFIRQFGSRGSGFGQFNYPWDVATNSVGEIVVSDTRNHRIQLFTAEGIFLRYFGMKYLNPHCRLLDSPRGVAFTREGDIIVTDFNTHRIVKIDYGFNAAKILNSDNLQRPQGLIVDDAGNIIVSDIKGFKVKILNQFGNYSNVFEYEGTGPEEVDRSAGIALLPNGKVVFVDCGNNRVLIR